MTRWAPTVLLVGSCFAAEGAAAQPAAVCRDVACWQELRGAECSGAAGTLESCLAFVQRLETARRGSYSSGVTLLLGETLGTLARNPTLPPVVKERYLERARAAFKEVVRREPLLAAGFLGLADVAETGEARVEWLRGAVQAESQPAHMEALAGALAGIGGAPAELEAAHVLETAYTFEGTDTEKWRYAVAALRGHAEAAERYPSATSERAVANVLLRLEEDVDYAILQRALRRPELHLTHLGDAFATLCEKSIVAIVGFEECTVGLELAVTVAERSAASGVRRALAEAVLIGMRTVAGEALPASMLTQRRFQGWLDRLAMTGLEPSEVEVDVLEARADYTSNLLDRSAVLLSAIELAPNRGDIRLKLGATYVSIRAWPEALDQLRVAKFFTPAEDQPRIDRLFETADKGYQARFESPAPTQ